MNDETRLRPKPNAGLVTRSDIRPRYWRQGDTGGINQNLTLILKIDRYALTDSRLDLPPAPFRVLRVTDKLTRL